MLKIGRVLILNQSIVSIYINFVLSVLLSLPSYNRRLEQLITLNSNKKTKGLLMLNIVRTYGRLY